MSKLTNLPGLAMSTIQHHKFDTLSDADLIYTKHYAEQFDEPIRTLVDIHTYCRPHNSGTIDEFVEKFLVERFAHLTPYFLTSPTTGENYALVIETDSASKTMFSCHVDTVHTYSGRQIVEYDKDMGVLTKPSKHRVQFGDCLGADDGAGIWLLIQMIEAGVRGVFVFHYGEERGGIGSVGIADDYPGFLQRFERAIAFDRKGTTDVITHQGMGRCCSDVFAKELAARLNDTGHGLSMAPDDDGIFTDTANYTHIIPECSNVACGYDGAHTSAEYLDVEYLVKLASALIAVDWETLPTKRDVTDIDPINDWGYGTYSFSKSTKKHTSAAPFGIDLEVDHVMQLRFGQMKDWATRSSADTIAEVLYELVDRLYAAEDDAQGLREELEYMANTQDTPPDYYDENDDDHQQH